MASVHRERPTRKNIEHCLSIGDRFERLVVLARAENGLAPGTRWLCKCDCGSEKVVSKQNLTQGQVKSCGCLHRESVGCRSKRHGESHHDGKHDRTLEYMAWGGMKSRCYNTKALQYPRYGGRGISICETWLHSFEAFLADMGRRPSSRHSLDRIDVNGNYEPANCRWATAKEQARNVRSNRLITIAGVTYTMAEWCERSGIGKSAMRNRLRRGIIGAALLSPVKKRIPEG